MRKYLFVLINILLIAISCTKSANADNTVNGSADNAYKVTFIELGSVNCIPCKMMQPIMKEIEAEYRGQVRVVFYDVWTKEGEP